jgi:hypothetical protein
MGRSGVRTAGIRMTRGQWGRAAGTALVGLLLFSVGLVSLPVGRAAPAATLPEGAGLAARYPGDTGLESDPDVIFAEDFERGTVAQIGARWGDISNRGGRVMALSADVPPGSRGKRSLQMTARVAENTGGHLYTVLKPGLDRAFLRFYVKFPDDAGYVHHFVTLMGQRDPKPYPEGRAGLRPAGDERFSMGIEPFGENGRVPPPGIWNFYTYWSEMKISADGRYWGNGLRPAKPVPAPRGRWQCVEVMVKGNTAPDRRDGELALWTDGVLRAHFHRGARRGPWTGLGFQLVQTGGEPFEGFLWRTDNAVKINTLWLLHYVTPEAVRRHGGDPGRPHRVWFDQVVVSRRYVGPIRSGRQKARGKRKKEGTVRTPFLFPFAFCLEPAHGAQRLRRGDGHFIAPAGDARIVAAADPVSVGRARAGAPVRVGGHVSAHAADPHPVRRARLAVDAESRLIAAVVSPGQVHLAG